jgi:ribonuclease HII
MAAQYVIGIDEVGRGTLAGPLLVVAARCKQVLPRGLADSKKLTKKQREMLFPKIRACCDIGKGWVEPAEIDALGLSGAMRLAVKRALYDLKAKNDDAIIMDGNVNYCPREFCNVKIVIKADSLHPIVSAASIYAKVLRDDYMKKIALEFPLYGFEQHVGYGTEYHRAMLEQNGKCPEHRVSFRPLARFA